MSEQRFTSLHPTADLPQLMAVLGAKRKPTNGLTPQQGWYSIKNVSEAVTEIYVYDEIGYYGVTANDFIRDLRDVKAKNITLRINSPGGDVFDGVAIYNAIRRHSAEVTVHVDGIAASAASFIAMAGDRVVMAPHSQMMIHEASGLCIGPSADMRQMADILDKSSDNIAAIYAEKAGGTVEEWRGRMKEETWLSDQEACDLGLADCIDGQEPKAKAPEIVNQTPEPIDFARLINEQIREAAETFA